MRYIHPVAVWIGCAVPLCFSLSWNLKERRMKIAINDLASERSQMQMDALLCIRALHYVKRNFDGLAKLPEDKRMPTSRFWELEYSNWEILRNGIQKIEKIWPISEEKDLPELVRKFNLFDTIRWDDYSEECVILLEKLEEELSYFADGQRGAVREIVGF